MYGDRVSQLDLRVAKILRFARATRATIGLDIYNVTNQGADQAFQYGGNMTFSPFFGQGAVRQFPRAVAISGRFMF